MKLAVSTPRRSVPMRRRNVGFEELIGAFESETLAVFARTRPRREHIVLYVLVLMLVLAGVLCAVVKLDRVVMGGGKIVPSAGSLYVSPYDVALVRQVLVKTGDVVKAGQPLATLDPTFTMADKTQLQQKLASDEAAVNRLQAEIAGQSYSFSKEDPYQTIQGGIYEKRRAEYNSNLGDFDARIRATEEQVRQYQADSEQYEQRLKLASDVEKVYQPLLSKGYVSKLQAMQAVDTTTEIKRLLADAENQMSSLQHTLASVHAQRDAYTQKWHSDIGAELVLSKNDLDLTRQNLAKAEKLSELTVLNSPAAAIVLKIGKVSNGSVASGGAQSASQEPLFTLVPLDAPVEADVNVDAAKIGFIKVGDPAALKLDAYQFTRHGMAKGVIKTISEGSFTTDENNTPVPPYFKVRIRVTDVSLHNVPADFRLIPGMTLTCDIMVGRRTILSYLVEGALRTGSEAMREP